MKASISKLLETQSMYDLALDMGISEYSLYCYVNNYDKISQRRKQLIENYIQQKGWQKFLNLYNVIIKLNTSFES